MSLIIRKQHRPRIPAITANTNWRANRHMSIPDREITSHSFQNTITHHAYLLGHPVNAFIRFASTMILLARCRTYYLKG